MLRSTGGEPPVVGAIHRLLPGTHWHLSKPAICQLRRLPAHLQSRLPPRTLQPVGCQVHAAHHDLVLSSPAPQPATAPAASITSRTMSRMTSLASPAGPGSTSTPAATTSATSPGKPTVAVPAWLLIAVQLGSWRPRGGASGGSASASAWQAIGLLQTQALRGSTCSVATPTAASPPHQTPP